MYTCPISILPGGGDAPVIFCRVAIHHAIGMAQSYRVNRKRWEALPERRRGKPPAIPTFTRVWRFWCGRKPVLSLR